MKKLNEEMIFNKINPLIEDSMSNEQKIETKRLIKSALPKESKKLININFNFWFFKIYYITFYLGKEKRETKRDSSLNNFLKALLIFFCTLILFLFAFSIITAIFLALYYIKSLIGIDIFQFHLLK